MKDIMQKEPIAMLTPNGTYQALVVDQEEDSVIAEIRDRRIDELPEGELLVRVLYSGVNYKDALACTKGGNVVRRYPFTPGIDLAGVVVRSRSDAFREGDEVFATGYELGVTHEGGYGGYASIPATWALHVPQGLTLMETMMLGTAGLTAAMSVSALQENGIRPGSGPILVTGASGGVGSLSVGMLAKLGYGVTASTGKPDMHERLLRLGASEVIDRASALGDSVAARPLQKQVWAGAVDSVGGSTLAAILSQLRYGGTVAASGLTGGTALAATVLPFILRGVRLIGIDSVYAAADIRRRLWDRMASSYRIDGLADICSVIPLSGIPEAVRAAMRGESRGRVVVRHEHP
jgi:acrylyl-CoA reductase (NADPH)